MNEFDIKAAGWDLNPMHIERSEAVATGIRIHIPLSKEMEALEYGSGTGITSFLLVDHLKEITMMDFSPEMVNIMNKKIKESGVLNLKTVLFDLEKENWDKSTFDLIIIQMALHHIADYRGIIIKFNQMLNPGGYLAIADLYPEDGSFHGEGFTGHKGFDPEILSEAISGYNFTDLNCEKCYSIKKQVTENVIKQFDVFLLIAKKLNK
jgi:tRNA (cmo5U34)-methyltransferase